VVVDAQTHAPYDRPPLSKEFLTGRFGVDDLGLRAANDLDVTWRLGSAATSFDCADSVGGNSGGTVTLDDGARLDADGVIIATGAAPRRLPVEIAAGSPAADRVGVLRTLDDAVWLRTLLDDGIDHLVVVGAGFIGLEVAASARQMGVAVTVLEPAPRPLSRVLGPEVGEAIAGLHRRNGVDLHLGVGVTMIGEASPARPFSAATRYPSSVADDSSRRAASSIVNSPWNICGVGSVKPISEAAAPARLRRSAGDR
jgi:NADPH-dependent 2,4-dienoyl-CoA reductase/sulfur reductase-like enzyme